MEKFTDRIAKSSKKKRSKIILALDLDPSTSNLLDKGLNILSQASQSICAVKINRHVLLPLGLLGGVKRLVDYAHRLDLPAIMDCKLNDIGSTNRVMAEWFFRAGFDALTVSPYVGWEQGLEPVFQLAKEQGKGLLVLTYMSHKGAEQTFEKALLAGYGKPKPAYKVFARWALKWKADGAIVGATRPEKIVKVKRILKGEVSIYSPGVGVQGGSLEEAVKSGADYLIIGRSILRAENPGEAAETLRERAWKAAGSRGRAT
ncbi:MAG: orotidine 5'-phosphate decarboxylase [Candidatus Hecatellaceae archaeon]